MNNQIPKIPKFFAIPFIAVLIGLIYFTITNFKIEYTLFFILGYMFTIGPMIIFFGMSDTNQNDTIDKKKSKLKNRSVTVGLFIILIGIATLFFSCADNDTYNFSINYMLNHLNAFLVFSLIMIAAGIFTIINGIIGSNKKPKLITARIMNIDRGNLAGERIVLFSDEAIEEGSLKSFIYKYFIYKTKDSEKFKEDEVYQFNIFKYGSDCSYMQVDEIHQARNLSPFTDEDFIKNELQEKR